MRRARKYLEGLGAITATATTSTIAATPAMMNAFNRSMASSTPAVTVAVVPAEKPPVPPAPKSPIQNVPATAVLPGSSTIDPQIKRLMAPANSTPGAGGPAVVTPVSSNPAPVVPVIVVEKKEPVVDTVTAITTSPTVPVTPALVNAFQTAVMPTLPTTSLPTANAVAVVPGNANAAAVMPTDPPKSNTKLYIGLGIAALLITGGIIATKSGNNKPGLNGLGCPDDPDCGCEKPAAAANLKGIKTRKKARKNAREPRVIYI